MTLAFLNNKKIVIAGAGANNRMLARYFGRRRIKYALLEWKNYHELSGRLKKYDVIFRTPGLPFLSEPVKEAAKRGVVIYSQTKLFFDLCPCPIIAVTGTKGKGTTASLINWVLKAGGKKVWLAGNIGKDPFEFLDQIKKNDLVVLELSSFQLQDLNNSPHIAVVLNITPDHLDHHQSFKEYVLAKAQILKHQSSSDYAFLSASLPKSFENLGQGKKIIFSRGREAAFKTRLLGAHNQENIAAAVGVARFLKVKEEIIKRAVGSFKGLPHRLQSVARKKGITFINDSASTNVETTAAAIDALKTPTVLILGGSNKGLNYDLLGQKIKRSKQVKALVIVGQTANKIVKGVKGYKGQVTVGAKNMPQIIKQALRLAKPGDTILLSPAAASFDMFKNYVDRGRQFIKLVKSLK